MNLIFEILKAHDEFAYHALFDLDTEAREVAFNKAEGIRELLSQIRESFKEDEQERFQRVMDSHFKAMASKLYKKSKE